MSEPATKEDLKRAIDRSTRTMTIMMALMVAAVLIGVYVLTK